MSESAAIFSSIAHRVTSELDVVKGTILTSVQSEFVPLITLLVILVIILMGYRLITASYRSQDEVFHTILKIVVVWVFVIGSTEYNSYITEGVEAAKGLVAKFVPMNTSEDIYTALDDILKNGILNSEKVRTQSSSGFWTVTAGEVASYVVIILLWIVTAIAFLMILVTDTLLTLFVAIGPLFFAFLLFDFTRQYFFAWVQAIVAILLLMLVVFFVVYIFSTVLSALVEGMVSENVTLINDCSFHNKEAGIPCAETDVRIPDIKWTNLIGAIVWSICSIFLLLGAVPVAGMLSAGVHAPQGAIHKAITTPLNQAATGAANGVKQLGAGFSAAILGTAPQQTPMSKDNNRRDYLNNNHPQINRIDYSPNALSSAVSGGTAQSSPASFSPQSAQALPAKTNPIENHLPGKGEAGQTGQAGQAGQVGQAVQTAQQVRSPAPTNNSDSRQGDTKLHNVKADSVSADNIHAERFSSGDKQPSNLHKVHQENNRANTESHSGGNQPRNEDRQDSRKSLHAETKHPDSNHQASQNESIATSNTTLNQTATRDGTAVQSPSSQGSTKSPSNNQETTSNASRNWEAKANRHKPSAVSNTDNHSTPVIDKGKEPTTKREWSGQSTSNQAENVSSNSERKLDSSKASKNNQAKPQSKEGLNREGASNKNRPLPRSKVIERPSQPNKIKDEATISKRPSTKNKK